MLFSELLLSGQFLNPTKHGQANNSFCILIHPYLIWFQVSAGCEV